MKSLLSLNSYHYARGGADIVYFAHAELFEANGWTNTFSAMHHADNVPCVDSPWFAECIDYHKNGRPLEKLKHAARIIYSLEAKKKISGLLDSRHIDIAHVHNIYHHQSPSVLRELKSRDIPVVMTAHDLKIACPNKMMMTKGQICERCRGGRVWNAALHCCVQDSKIVSSLVSFESAIHKALNLYDRNVDRIVTPSRFYRDKLIEWGWNGDKIVHIPNFVRISPEVRQSPGGGYILYFGRLAKEKGLTTLVRAAAQARVPVRIAGTGPEEGILRLLVDELDAPVTFLGFLNGEALWSAVDAARAIVLPSEWYENGPMSVIEAFGRGKPLIGSRIGGIPELITEGETGWSFVPADVSDLAEALTTAMAATKSELGVMAEATRDRVVSDFSADMYYRRMSTVYGGII